MLSFQVAHKDLLRVVPSSICASYQSQIDDALGTAAEPSQIVPEAAQPVDVPAGAECQGCKLEYGGFGDGGGALSCCSCKRPWAAEFETLLFMTGLMTVRLVVRSRCQARNESWFKVVIVLWWLVVGQRKTYYYYFKPSAWFENHRGL